MQITDNKLAVIIAGQAIQIDLTPVRTDAIVRAWSVPTEYRDSGVFVAITESGQPSEVPACSPRQAVYLGEVEYPAGEAAKLANAKAAKLTEINTACDLAARAYLSPYPEVEISTWPQQSAEAAAYSADPGAATPLLSEIATARGLTMDDLAARVLAKETLFKTTAGALLGQRQALEDQIDSAVDPEEVSAIAFGAFAP